MVLWMLVHWDGDRTFGNTNETFIGSLRNVRRYFHFPQVRRTLNYYLTELLTQYTKGSVRTETWLDVEEDSSSKVRAGKNTYTRWFQNRERAAERYIGDPFDETNFEVTEGEAETTAAAFSLSGTSPSTVYTIQVEGHPEAEVHWSNTTDWELSNIRLAEGENVLKIMGVSHEGKVRTQVEFTVNKTNGAPPVVNIAGSPASLRLGVSDELLLDATASYDPDGQPLTFQWSGPEGVAITPDAQGSTARVTFPSPGVYPIQLSVMDAGGTETAVVPQVSVYGQNGFSSFNELMLGGVWSTANISEISNYSPSAWYSLTEQAGRLTIQVLDDSAKPLGLPEPELPEPISFVELDSEWRFDDSNTAFGPEWKDPDYDDGAWNTGKGLFGFESTPLDEPGLQTDFRRDSANGLLTYYLRTEFNFDRSPVGAEFSIDHFLDDGVVYYLNGQELGRVGMPDGEITHTTQATGSTSNASLETNVLSGDGTGLLRDGVNVFAAELHNGSAGSSDAVLGARLNIAAAPKSGGELSLDGTVHPWITRPVPASEDWTMETKLTLETLQTGDFLAGLQVETEQDGGEIRYAVGYEDGKRISAFQIGANTGTVRLGSVDFESSASIEVRLARQGSQLVFSMNDETGWEEVHVAALAGGAKTIQAGPVVATEVPVSTQVSFDYVLLAEPGSARSPLAGQLIISEIMYHPEESPEPEFLEFFNAHSQPISLQGAKFRAGNPFGEYTFGDVTLAPGAYAVLVKDATVFAARHGQVAGLLGAWGGGSLANGGERIAIDDASGNVILDFRYNDKEPWPESPDGTGPSLVLVNPEASPDHGNSANWRAGMRGGTPGRGEGATGSGAFADWMTANGFADPLEDPDGDGLSHLLTFALGKDLAGAGSAVLPTAQFVGDIPGLSFRMRNGSDIDFTVEVSKDLRTWTANAELIEETDNGDGTSMVLYRAADAGTPQFFRLKVATP